MVTKILVILALITVISCKPFKRDRALEGAAALKSLQPIVTFSQCRSSDDWCLLFLKYELPESDYLAIVKKLDLKHGSTYPILGSLKEADDQTMKKWNPGPGLGGDQISSKYLYSKLIDKPHDYPQSFIASIYKDGYMYINAVGFRERIIKEISGVIPK